MAAFEYIIITIALIVGLGLTQILKGLAHLVRCREVVRFYWVHLIWILLLLFFHIEIWWGMWGLRNTELWSFEMYLIRFAVPVSLFFLAVLIFPDLENLSNKSIDLKEYYFSNHRWFFLVFTTYPLSLIVTESLLGNQPISHWANGIRLALLVTVLLLAWRKEPLLHAILTCCVAMVISVLIAPNLALISTVT